MISDGRTSDNDVMERIGKNIWEVRRRAGFSQEMLAERSGLHRTEISLIERGGRVPRIDTLLKIAGSLECPIETLVEGVEWVPFSPSAAGMFSVLYNTLGEW
jgi:transcriptional regulator with XRE-family HTH domain